MKRGKPDFWLILITFTLLGIGLIMVFSASYFKGYVDLQDSYYFFKKQLVYGLLGLVLFFVVSNIPYQVYRKYVGIILFLSLFFLLAVLLFGEVRNGARRWIDLGFFDFQPSELVKLGMIIYTASIMVKKQPLLDNFKRALLPPLIVIGLVSSLLVLEPHFSATVIIVTTCFVIIFCSGARIKHLALLLMSGIPAMILIMLTSDYRIERLHTLLNPLSNPNDEGYQIIQSLIAIGPGGLTGVGLGESIQKLAYLPEAHTDFIFSIISEELGFVGGSFVILLFILFIVRGVLIALQAPDQFGTLLGIGIVTLMAIESIFNLGVVTALLPVTGVPLPLISYGGTALIIKMIGLGMLLNISRYRTKKEKTSKRPTVARPVHM
ncbi:putative lipid II flippase FtsW [Laceyella sacchari]|jgi:cell division protein FtsW|uniref:Lipid II flippase FtsW n=1 Tax=Laceyella sacchari TaxID=37482 RepID=A0ABY5TZG0_LACSH|nr:putative lipid II flippase FtsW [Laceyella sacchari]TCW37650.1 cell division protein FtsW [Laceyella sacchari]UWE02801.1 putative lipid II flippase FtsW [Laceyella sacchari]